ncbi:MAG: DUF2974 domain-containing protein [Acetatifactor sp.]|nr:DUF2974 domain-containing protein [Acetatifactor sp.]MDE7112910.1 DUF2974 domain-containing protein [Acetatifactor sp.]
MSDTMHNYLKEYGDISFMERPMNDVDSLVLCQFVYLKFDGLVPELRESRRSVSLEELAGHPQAEKLFADERFAKDNRELFEDMLAGRRFRNMKINCHINVIEKEWETQFSAATFILEDGTIYVAFRGTDETIVGWKEDFNMAFLSPVPGQALSVKYLNIVTERFHNPFYVGGHSKGGNLAVYSAMNCADVVQERILKVYSMDGPGFRPEVLEQCGYDRIADRVVKLLPHSSMIGMIFEWDTRYQVVESRSFGLAQHNPYNWKIKNGEFVLAEDIYGRARLVDNTINEWISSLDNQQIKLFVDTLYQVISASEADDLISITADWKRSMTGVVAALKEVDEDTAKVLQEIVKGLFELARVRMKEELGLPLKKTAEQAKSRRRPKRRTEAVHPTA